MRKYTLYTLFLVTVGVWLAVFQSPEQNLQVIACDVGQGDAILIQHQSDQILIDGGPDSKVLDCLGRYMPFWDRKIELVVNTHPERDHAGGLIDVFDNYEVDSFLTNDLNEPVFSTSTSSVLKSRIGGVANVLHPTSDILHLRLGLIYLDILRPLGELPITKNQSPNNLSIVLLLKYSNYKALFLGDIENVVSDKLSIVSSVQGVDYIKIPHHGSKNGLSQKLLDATSQSLPAGRQVAVISVGAKNSYGHPHESILNMLARDGLRVLRTDLLGDIVVETDGRDIYIDLE